MALIPLALAAQRLGVSEETIKDWAQRGLLSIHLGSSGSSKGVLSLIVVQELVDEDELVEVAESLGWLQLSAEGWGGVSLMAVRHPFRRGDVVLVSFPFSDASGQKERPAIVLSADDYHEEWNEVLVVAITSRQPKTLRKTDCELKDWRMAGLKQPSWVRSHLATVHYQFVVRKIGVLSQRDLQAVE
ncbi:MAG: hypothetical protein HZLCBSQH_001962 [Candidatus Fervidibacterota bacterium]